VKVDRRSWSFEATASAPGEGRRGVSAFAASAGATAPALDSIAICVSEAMTNVVVHAYRHEARVGTIDVAAELDGDWLRVTVSDHGGGLEPRLDSPGLGLGLPLIAQMSAASEIVSPERGGTEIVMRFDLREREGNAP
jgi:anti-sigma regulatory factor (Ser/Thr protein kinase)